MFEGLLEEPDPEFGCVNMASGCMIPTDNYEEALKFFKDALLYKKIRLVKITDEIAFDVTDFNAEDEEEKEWIEMYEFTKQRNVVVFSERYVY